MLHHRRCAAALALCLPLAAAAAEPVKPLGAEARAWVQLQQDGKQAAPGPRAQPGEIADHVYQRYADSFKQPVPAEFKRQPAGDAGGK